MRSWYFIAETITANEQAARNVLKNANNPTSHTAQMLDYLPAKVDTFLRVARVGRTMCLIGGNPMWLLTINLAGENVARFWPFMVVGFLPAQSA